MLAINPLPKLMPKAQDSYSLIHRRNTSSTRPVTKECFQLIFVTNFLDRCGKKAPVSGIDKDEYFLKF
jgi:hypothetical protein